MVVGGGKVWVGGWGGPLPSDRVLLCPQSALLGTPQHPSVALRWHFGGPSVALWWHFGPFGDPFGGHLGTPLVAPLVALWWPFGDPFGGPFGGTLMALW